MLVEQNTLPRPTPRPTGHNFLLSSQTGDIKQIQLRRKEKHRFIDRLRQKRKYVFVKECFFNGKFCIP
jgi:hypothetical protein